MMRTVTRRSLAELATLAAIIAATLSCAPPAAAEPPFVLELEGFAAAQQRTNERLVVTNPYTRASVTGPVREAERDGIRIFTAPRDLTDTLGKVNHFVNGLLVGPGFTVSIVSPAASPAQAEANFDAFVPHLVDLLWMELGAQAGAAALFPGSPAPDRRALASPLDWYQYKEQGAGLS